MASKEPKEPKEPINADLLRLKREVLKDKILDSEYRLRRVNDFFGGDFKKVDKKEKKKRQQDYDEIEQKAHDFDDSILNL